MLKHNDDDGDLSVFAGETQLLFACSKGHYWLVDAQRKDLESEETRIDVNRLASAFGPDLEIALGVASE